MTGLIFHRPGPKPDWLAGLVDEPLMLIQPSPLLLGRLKGASTFGGRTLAISAVDDRMRPLIVAKAGRRGRSCLLCRRGIASADFREIIARNCR